MIYHMFRLKMAATLVFGPRCRKSLANEYIMYFQQLDRSKNRQVFEVAFLSLYIHVPYIYEKLNNQVGIFTKS